jgi:hypothetical protein
VLDQVEQLLAARVQTQPRRPLRTLTATWMACRASPPPAASDMVIETTQLAVCTLRNVRMVGIVTVLVQLPSCWSMLLTP